MILNGIASAVAGEIEDWYTSRAEAEVVLEAIPGDEPDLDGELWVEALELEQSQN